MSSDAEVYTGMTHPDDGATYLRIRTQDYRQLSWTEINAAFNDIYPDRWAMQLMPPAEEVVDDANVYHLYMMEEGWLPARWMNINRLNSIIHISK